MDPKDFSVLQAMIQFGGSFVSCLGRAGLHANADNLQRLKAAWPEYWAKYLAVVESRKGEQ